MEDQPIAPNDGFYWAFLALLGWGCADYLARSASGRFGSVSVTLLTLTIGLAVPLPFVLVEISQGSLVVDWAELVVWGLATGAFLGVAYLVYYTGLQRGSVTVVSTAASAWLAVTVVIAVAAFGESLSLGQVGLMAVIFVGILMLSAGRVTEMGVRTGLAWGLGAMLTIGVAMGLIDRVTEAAGPMLAVLVVRSVSIVPTYAFVRFRRMGVRLPSERSGWTLLVAVGLLDAGAYVGYNLGVDSAPVAVIAPIAAAHPVATIALAVALSRERPHALHWAGAVAAIGATVGLSFLVGA